MSELINDDTKINELLKLLSIYYTVRIDIKNYDDVDNGKSIEIMNISDPSAKITCPERFQKKGTGILIRSNKLSIDLKIKCKSNGVLDVTVRGLKAKDREGNIFPAYIDFSTLKINGKEHIKENQLIWYENPLKIRRKVKDCELITIHTEWKPFNSSSLYEVKSEKELEAEIEELKTKISEIEELKTKNQDLEKEIEELKTKNQDLEKEKNNFSIFKSIKKNKK